jgi:uridine kinase
MVVNKNKPYIILITGASGSGKTAALKALEQKLSSDLASINYFDDMGIPSTGEMVAKYGSGEKWQEWAHALGLTSLFK